MPPLPQPESPDAPDRSPEAPSPHPGWLREGLRATSAGALLALACWGLAAHGNRQVVDAGYAGVLALVMVGAGAAAVVLHGLHLHGQGPRPTRSSAAQLARRLVLLLGLSFSAALHLLNTCLPG